MKKIATYIIIACLLFTGCSGMKESSKPAKIEGSFYKSTSGDIKLSKINDTVWVHTSYTDYGGSRTPSNGIVAISSEGLLLVDTPWTNDQTEELLNLTKKVFQQDVKLAIITHAHEDRIGGIGTLLEHNIDVRSTAQTAELAERAGYHKPEVKLDSEPNLKLGDLQVETYYPGQGHSPDNLVVWFPQSEVLFAGCIVKSLEAKDLGSTTDANIEQWPASVAKVLDHYQNAEIVIPGHGKWGDVKLIQHTLDLLKTATDNSGK